jgi:hypothetical protein
MRMVSRKRVLRAGVLVLVLLVGAAVVDALWTRDQDMSLDEALAAELPLPIYSLDHTRLGFEAPIMAHYFYFDLGDEYRLETYFYVGDADNESGPVAVLVNTTLPDLMDNELIEQTAAIQWAEEGSGHTCEVWAWFERAEVVGPAAYQSCLYWKANGRHYKFYAVWPEVDAIRAVNALEAVPANR